MNQASMMSISWFYWNFFLAAHDNDNQILGIMGCEMVNDIARHGVEERCSGSGLGR